jgi:hypothetical protein
VRAQQALPALRGCNPGLLRSREGRWYAAELEVTNEQNNAVYRIHYYTSYCHQPPATITAIISSNIGISSISSKHVATRNPAYARPPPSWWRLAPGDTRASSSRSRLTPTVVRTCLLAGTHADATDLASLMQLMGGCRLDQKIYAHVIIKKIKINVDIYQCPYNCVTNVPANMQLLIKFYMQFQKSANIFQNIIRFDLLNSIKLGAENAFLHSIEPIFWGQP